MKISPSYVIREIAGEHIVVPTGEAAAEFNGLITVNGSGLLLWKLLQQEATEEELLQALLEEYDIDEAAAREDLAAFLRKLDENGILRK